MGPGPGFRWGDLLSVVLLPGPVLSPCPPPTGRQWRPPTFETTRNVLSHWQCPLGGRVALVENRSPDPVWPSAGPSHAAICFIARWLVSPWHSALPLSVYLPLIPARSPSSLLSPNAQSSLALSAPGESDSERPHILPPRPSTLSTAPACWTLKDHLSGALDREKEKRPLAVCSGRLEWLLFFVAWLEGSRSAACPAPPHRTGSSLLSAHAPS